MARPSFYNDNLMRSYPFVPAADGSHAYPMTNSAGATKLLPNSLLVDFLAIAGQDAGWSAAPWLYLVSIEALSGIDAGRFVLHFYTDAPGAIWLELKFILGPTLAEFSPITVAAVVKGSDVTPFANCDDPLFLEGTAVFGRLDELAALMSPGEVLTADPRAVAVEPVLVQDLASSYVRSLNVANAPRLHVAPPAGCGGAGPQDDLLVVNRRCIGNDVVFIEGYNCAIAQAARDNSLTFSGAVGGGAGQACEEVPLFDGELPPDNGSLLTGGPTCNEVVTSINGFSTRLFQLEAGAGVKITTEAHKLIVEVGYGDMVAGCSGG